MTTTAPVKALERVLERVLETRASGEVPVVVFDLDDTLFSTQNRHLRILGEFAASRAGGAQALASLPPGALRYSIKDTARAAGVTDEALLRDLQAFWFERFFADEYLGADAPVPGAPAFVRSVIEAGGVVVYLTGRDETMREGTLQALEQAGFPAPDGEAVRLILKPRFDAQDLAFKREAFETVAALGAVAAGFENEPAYLNAMLERFPRMLAVLLETQHSGKPCEPHEAILRVKDFTY